MFENITYNFAIYINELMYDKLLDIGVITSNSQSFPNPNFTHSGKLFNLISVFRENTVNSDYYRQSIEQQDPFQRITLIINNLDITTFNQLVEIGAITNCTQLPNSNSIYGTLLNIANVNCQKSNLS